MATGPANPSPEHGPADGFQGAVASELVEAEETVAELVAADEADAELARTDPAAPHKHQSRFLERMADRRVRHLERGYLYRVSFAAGGFCVLAAGLAMLVLPGPGLLVTAIGLAMLALEFAWAERMLVRVVHRLEQAKDQTRRLFRRRRSQA
jgi:uncharacterized protein (TIGR02611 family)